VQFVQDHPANPADLPPRIAETKTPAAKLSVIETAAKRGIGPMSLLGREVWHAQARPCPSCGELVRREDSLCEFCGQDLSAAMLARMQAYAGPWYVHEHVRPFPGVTLERLIRQVRRGLLTATTVVRGPTTLHQWRFAGETPGLSKYLGRCWKCDALVTEQETYCPECDTPLDYPGVMETPEQASTAPATPSELDRLSLALHTADRFATPGLPIRPRRGVPVGMFVAGVVTVCVLAVLLAVRWRGHAQNTAPAPLPAVTPASPGR
jgi:RNA polymerase subunit RPABC4/transcription elongation factor Spt4